MNEAFQEEAEVFENKSVEKIKFDFLDQAANTQPGFTLDLLSLSQQKFDTLIQNGLKSNKEVNTKFE